MNNHIGEFVYATFGRDKGKCFVVVKEDDYLYLCDGKRRRAQSPKKKSKKHVIFTGHKDEEILLCAQSESLTSKKIRYALKRYTKNISET